MKKIVISSIAAFLILGSNVSAAFSDVSADYTYKTAIDYVQSEEIVSGYSDGTFRPENPITRGEFTKIIIKALKNQDDIDKCMFAYSDGVAAGTGYYKKIFSDVESGTTINSTKQFSSIDEILSSYSDDQIEGYGFFAEQNLYFPTIRRDGNRFVKYICAAKYYDILDGYSDGTFKPDVNISVGEASKIIVNSFDITVENSIGEGVHKFESYLIELSKRNALPPTLFHQDDYLKRGEMAEIIYRLKNNITDKPSTDVTNLSAYYPIGIVGKCGSLQTDSGFTNCQIHNKNTNQAIKVLTNCTEGVNCGNEYVYLGLKTNGGQYYLSISEAGNILSVEVYYFDMETYKVEKIRDFSGSSEDDLDKQTYDNLVYKFTQDLI